MKFHNSPVEGIIVLEFGGGFFYLDDRKESPKYGKIYAGYPIGPYTSRVQPKLETELLKEYYGTIRH